MLKGILVLMASLYVIPTLAGTISISFDDIPRKDTYLSGKIRSQKIIHALERQKTQAVFYVNTNRVDSAGLKRIKAYQRAGHIIGNHTHSHVSADAVLEQVFLADFNTADKMLRSWGFRPTYFRYPYLHRGQSPETIRNIRNTILKAGYQDGFVTVDNYDWYMDHLFQESVKKGEKIDFGQLKAMYTETLFRGIQHYEELGRKVYGRSAAHVLLLHENDLAAMFIGDLIELLRQKGWSICSPGESYDSTDLTPFPEKITRHGQGRIVAHATAKGFPKPLLSGLEDEEVLETLWAGYRINVKQPGS